MCVRVRVRACVCVCVCGNGASFNIENINLLLNLLFRCTNCPKSLPSLSLSLSRFSLLWIEFKRCWKVWKRREAFVTIESGVSNIRNTVRSDFRR